MATKTSTTDLHSLGVAEIHQRLRQSQQELETARLKARQGSLEQPHQIRATRRVIAQLLTILNSKARPA